MPTVFLKPDKDARITAGYLWIFSGEIARLEGKPEDGGIVDIRTLRGKWLGRGFINPASSLAVRALTTQPEPIDDAFWRRRIGSAVTYRQRFVHGTTAYRLIYSEGDFLPGLIVDRYGEVLVLQTLALGMDRRKEMLADLLMDLVHPQAIYERNDATVRRLEGLDPRRGWLRGTADPVIEIQEPARFSVDVAAGQKTGFYLDQRENRTALAPYVRDADVLDVFCYTGGFAVHAALAGARRVTGIDSSADALHLARANAALNGVDSVCEFVEANAFDELRRLVTEKASYDVVILDPPPFAPTKEAVERASAGYKELNLRALKLLRPGGILLTCSCSYHVGDTLLQQIVGAAAADARRAVRLIESRGQARDHPVHPAMPETRYLCCLVVEVG